MKKTDVGAWDIAHGKRACLAGTKPWVQSPALKEKKKRGKETTDASASPDTPPFASSVMHNYLSRASARQEHSSSYLSQCYWPCVVPGVLRMGGSTQGEPCSQPGGREGMLGSAPMAEARSACLGGCKCCLQRIPDRT